MVDKVTLTRIYDAPRELVYKAWTDPSLMARWFGPKVFTSPICELDVRPGGEIYIVMRDPDGVNYPMTGLFQEVIEPERLVFTTRALADEAGRPQLETLDVLTLEDLGGKTRLTLEVTVIKATPAAEGALSGMEEGWSQSLDKLDEQLRQIAAETKSKKTVFTVEPGKQEVVITRVFDAPRDLVFKVFTDPNLVPEFWGPKDLTTTVEQMDVRPGGLWRFVQRDSMGSIFAFKGVYHEVVPPERLVYTFEFEGTPGHILLETVTFEELPGGRTKLTDKSVYQSVNDRDGMVQAGMELGATDTMERVAALLARVKV